VERFARSGAISVSQSKAVFEALRVHGFLDRQNCFIGVADDLATAVESHPENFPVIKSLSFSQQTFVTAQITLFVSAQKMYGDFDHAMAMFLDDPCY